MPLLRAADFATQRSADGEPAEQCNNNAGDQHQHPAQEAEHGQAAEFGHCQARASPAIPITVEKSATGKCASDVSCCGPSVPVELGLGFMVLRGVRILVADGMDSWAMARQLSAWCPPLPNR